MTPPVLTPTPGAGDSIDPDIIDKLALNDHLFLQEFDRYREIVNFLNAFRDWKLNSVQRAANGLTINPPPVPPAGYTLPVDPPAPPPPAPNFTPIVEPRTQFGTYPAPFDLNPAGTVIANPFQPGATLTKVSQRTPFGDAQYWIDTVGK